MRALCCRQALSTIASSWPRGFPLDAIKDNRTTSAPVRRRAWLARHVGVIQSLADHDPDVDGIYRLTQPLPFNFPPATTNDARYGRQLSQLSERLQSKEGVAQPTPSAVGSTARAATSDVATAVAGRALQVERRADGPSSDGESGGRTLQESGPLGASKAKSKAFGGKSERGVVSLRPGTMMPYNAQVGARSHRIPHAGGRGAHPGAKRAHAAPPHGLRRSPYNRRSL